MLVLKFNFVLLWVPRERLALQPHHFIRRTEISWNKRLSLLFLKQNKTKKGGNLLIQIESATSLLLYSVSGDTWKLKKKKNTRHFT